MTSQQVEPEMNIDGDVVKEAREILRKKRSKNISYIEEEQIDEDFVNYTITIDVKVKKNGKSIPPTKDVLNWCGNILSTKP